MLRQLRTCQTLFGYVLVRRPLRRERNNMATLEVSGRQSGASSGWHPVGRGLPLRSALFAINVDSSVGGGGIHEVKRHYSSAKHKFSLTVFWHSLASLLFFRRLITL